MAELVDAGKCKMKATVIKDFSGNDIKVYGPYKRKEDGRMHVIIVGKNGIRRTVSYPKHLMEQHLGREPTDDETVDHIDRNFDNNDLSNFRIIKRSLHIIDDVIRVKRVEITCARPGCGKKAFKRANDITHNSVSGRAGPFCGKSCAGQYGASVQNGGEKLPIQKPIPKEEREYFRNIKDIDNSITVSNLDKIALTNTNLDDTDLDDTDLDDTDLDDTDLDNTECDDLD